MSPVYYLVYAQPTSTLHLTGAALAPLVSHAATLIADKSGVVEFMALEASLFVNELLKGTRGSRNACSFMCVA